MAGNSLSEENYSYSFYNGDDGLVYLEVRQNDDSAPKENEGEESNSDSFVGLYRINASDYLEKKDNASGTWQVVSETYFE